MGVFGGMPTDFHQLISEGFQKEALFLLYPADILVLSCKLLFCSEAASCKGQYDLQKRVGQTPKHEIYQFSD